MMLLSACAKSYPKLVDRKPDATLLIDCVRPDQVPAWPTDTEVAKAWVDSVEKYVECEARYSALRKFVQDVP